MNELMTTFTVEDPATGKKLYIPISNEDLLTKTQQEIIEMIESIMKQEFN